MPVLRPAIGREPVPSERRPSLVSSQGRSAHDGRIDFGASVANEPTASRRY
jgi:hypothetical protein